MISTRAVSTGVKDIGAEHQAKVFEAEWLAQQRAVEIASGEPRIAALIDAYTDRAIARGFDRSRLWQLNRLKEDFGAHRASTLTMREVNEIFTRRNLGVWSVYTFVTLLKTVFNHARRTRLIPADTQDHLVLPRTPQGRVVFLDEDQENEFYALACGLSIGRQRLNQVTLFACLGLDTGARKSAILGLTWDRVRLDDNVIDYREPGRGVSGKRRATPPINARLRPIIERAYSERRKGAARVFDTLQIDTPWRNFVRPAGWDWVTPHVLRHTYITLMLKAGVEVSEVAELVADRPETIWKTYKHVKSEWLQDAADARHKKFFV